MALPDVVMEKAPACCTQRRTEIVRAGSICAELTRRWRATTHLKSAQDEVVPRARCTRSLQRAKPVNCGIGVAPIQPATGGDDSHPVGDHGLSQSFELGGGRDCRHVAGTVRWVIVMSAHLLCDAMHVPVGFVVL